MFDVGAESTDTIRNLVTYDEDVTIFDKKIIKKIKKKKMMSLTSHGQGA